MTARVSLLRGAWLLSALLSMTAGAVDAIGFLSLGGLFAAHITGNLVLVAAHYATGGFGQLERLLAIPVFIAVVGMVTLTAGAIDRAGYESRRALLVLQAVLLAGSLGLGIGFGPFADAGSPTALFVGMLTVAAMATQNTLVRLTLPGVPTTAVMTTNMTQLTIDLATLARRRRKTGDLAKPENFAGVRHRASATLLCVFSFVVGCAAGATMAFHFGLWALALPVVLAVLAAMLKPTVESARDVEDDHKRVRCTKGMLDDVK